ncbi:MAG: nitrogenase [Oscillospiraceae bacterium]|jgi:nitrogenase molybdenum-iron protein alpha chain|nr:nitrogenase [Oscillospiraceae bacterium]
MSANLDLSSVEVRERRLKSIISYNGTAKDLSDKSKSKSLNIRERSYGQCSDCAQGCGQVISYTIRGAAVIEHSPIGCSAPAVSALGINVANKARGLPPQKTNVLSTNLTEKDTVYGGIEKLNATVREAKRRFDPTAIFVQSSCAAGIIGDDIESATTALQEELGIPVVPIFCEGFKSRIWSTGFDASFHGILRKIVKEPKKKQPDLVNVFNFEGSDTFTPLLAPLGLRVNYVVPLSDVHQLEELSEAACSTHICETLATYPANALEKYYGVPEVKAPPPFGVKWTDEWLRDIARITGKQDLVEDYIAREHERIKPELEAAKEKLKGLKFYIFAGDSYAHSIANMLLDLGVDLIGVTTLHHDQLTDGGEESIDSLGNLVNSHGDVPNFTVCNKQPYQVYKILTKLKPDVMIVRHMNMAVLGAKLGIPSINDGDVNISAGYDGLARLAERLYQASKAKKLFQNVAAHTQNPYSEWWLSQEDPFYFEGGHQ